MKRPIALALLLATLPLSVLQAQDRTGAFPLVPMHGEKPTRPDGPAAGRDEAEAHMRALARCVVMGDPATARSILASAPGSDDEHAIMMHVAKSRSGCLHRGKLRMKGNWMRGAIAEQLYLRSYPTSDVSAPQPDAPFQASADARKWPYHAYADCIVTRNAPAADAVVRATPGSVAEKSALRQTMPTLSSCLAGGADSKLAIDRTMLRGYLAESLYMKRSPAG